MSTGREDATYRGWARPGPVPPGALDSSLSSVAEGESLDWLCGHWKIFQYEKGHRYSSDDVLCAWYASTWAPRVDRYCDLGSGIGSVANIVAWRLPGARVVTVEAQEISLALAKKTQRYNGLDERMALLHGDLRDAVVLDEAVRVAGGAFDLVTGSPPYWPVGTALASAHAQAVPARLEVRGDVADYAKSAARILAPGGVFACVFQASQHDRVKRAIADADLVLLRSRHVVFKEGAPPDEAGVVSGLVLYVAACARDVPTSFPRAADDSSIAGKPVVEPPLIIRRSDGSTHPEYATVRLSFGFPPGDVGPSSALQLRREET